jgi:antitoxin (DNA-binding transcriptional repressor) of toxin-antitoxin stability system
MISVNISEAETHLEELIEKARAGEEVVITGGDGKTPMVRLVALEPFIPKRLGARETPGFELTDAFWEPLPEEELRLWNGEVSEVSGCTHSCIAEGIKHISRGLKPALSVA